MLPLIVGCATRIPMTDLRVHLHHSKTLGLLYFQSLKSTNNLCTLQMKFSGCCRPSQRLCDRHEARHVLVVVGAVSVGESALRRVRRQLELPPMQRVNAPAPFEIVHSGEFGADPLAMRGEGQEPGRSGERGDAQELVFPLARVAPDLLGQRGAQRLQLLRGPSRRGHQSAPGVHQLLRALPRGHKEQHVELLSPLALLDEI